MLVSNAYVYLFYVYVRLLQLQESLPSSAVSLAFIGVQDVVTGGADMYLILARIHAERHETARPAPGVVYQNKVKIIFNRQCVHNFNLWVCVCVCVLFLLTGKALLSHRSAM